MAPKVPLIVLRNVSKEFNKRKALKNINLEFYEGESIGILGRSGSGKSILIHTIGGIRGYEPDEGEIFFNVNVCPECLHVDSLNMEECPKCGSKMHYREINFWKENNLKLLRNVKLRIAIMFQRTFGVYGNLTTLDNVIEAFRLAEVNEKERYEKAADLLQLVNLMHRSSHAARDLSGGEKQRLVLARQIAKNPMILLTDDPTGTLDFKNSQIICQVLSQVKSNRLLIATSHFPEIILSTCEKAILLEGGELVKAGDSKTLVKEFLKEVSPMKIRREEVCGKPVIRLSNIRKYYHKIASGIIKAVDDVNLQINEKCIFGIVGESGAGKTTLSKIMVGVIQPTSGSVHIRVGEGWVDLGEPGMLGRGRATSHIGVLYQEYSLYPYLTVIENLAKSKDLGIPDEFAKLKAIYTLKGVGFTAEQIDDILTKHPDELSEGEKHRVALAWVLMRDPRILIADEPSGTMDPMTKMEVSKSLKKAREEFGTTIVIVSHDLEFALQCCDLIALMHDGKIVEIGRPEQVVEKMRLILA